MKAARIISFAIIILLISGPINPSPLLAQTKAEKEHFRIDMQFGNRNIYRDSLPNGADIDFMNYLFNDKEYSDYQFLELGFTLATSDTWSFKAGFKMLSDMQPSHFSITARYYADSLNASFQWGITSSFSIYPQYLDAFNRFHILADTGFTADLNTNFRQRTLNDMGLDISPFLSYNHKRFHCILTTGIGVYSFMPFQELVTQKKTNANLRREIRYETSFSPSISSLSEIEAGFDLITGQKRTFGISLKAGILLLKRNIPYNRTTYTWTETDVITVKVNPDKKLYTKSDLSWGIYLRF